MLLFGVLLALCGSTTAQQTLYVKSDAAGANNGTSWQNAYTNLRTALAAASPGDQVWVAAGTYKPTGGAANATFAMSAGVALYGGFNGTESTLSARNPVTNVTILNGDLAGNDIIGNFTTNRTDNSLHVVEITPSANPDDRAIVDGFVISGGQTLIGASNPDLTRRGGGLLTTAKATVRNCRFADNNGDTGGALAAVNTTASGLIVEDCIFEKNNTALLSAGVYLRDLSGGSSVRRCIFRENKTIRGSLYVITSANMVVDSCQFLNNDAALTPCSGMYTWQTTFTLTNSIFKGNRANDFTGMYNDGRDGVFPFTIDNCLFEDNVAIDPTNAPNTADGGAIFNATTTGTIRNCIFKNNGGHRGGAIFLSGNIANNKNIVENCLFEDNRAVPGANTTASRGGAIFANNAVYEATNCLFRKNNANTSGAHIHNDGGTRYTVTGCRFEAGTSTFGAATANYNANTIGTYENCEFVGNTAATSGGASSTAFTAKTTIKNCLIENNNARFGGGMFVQNTNSELTVQDCSIFSNNAQDNGGGINISAGAPLLIERCIFELNTGNVGGAINYTDDTANVGRLTVRNTAIQNNFANNQGAGINISNTNTELTNTLFFSNLNLGAGAGGALINNAAGSTSPVIAVNCTFADNLAPIGSGIAQWQDATGTATLTLQNCIVYNSPGVDYEIEDGTPTVVSAGGNLGGDQTLAAVLVQTNDQIGLDPKFVDPSFYDYRLLAGSPCIDKGVAAGAPTTDLDGNPRDSKPDQGCYEFQTVGTRLPSARQVLPLRLLPNPAAEHSVLVLEGDWSGQAQVTITAQNGAQARAFTAYKPSGRWIQPVDVRDLPAGVYSVQVLSGASRYEGRLVKQ